VNIGADNKKKYSPAEMGNLERLRDDSLQYSLSRHSYAASPISNAAIFGRDRVAAKFVLYPSVPYYAMMADPDVHILDWALAQIAGLIGR
jgi:hypothetical protein